MNVPFLDLKQQYQNLKSEIEPEILKVMESCAYIGGSYVQNFEKEAAAYLGAKYAIGCSSGTSALMLALRACNVRPGDEVITTPFTFFATAEAVAAVGAVPVFVDVKQDDYNIDPEKIEAAVTEKTKAILPVHIFGAPCDMDSIMEIARRHHLKVIEDDAQAIGSEYKGRKAGTLGDIGCFSFYPTKNLGGCGDGGMVTTNDENLRTILLALREHGAGKNGAAALELLDGVKAETATSEKATELYDPYKYFNYLIGYNARLDALQACVLSVKLKHLDQFNERRARIAKAYMDGLTGKLRRPVYAENTRPCWHQFAVRSAYKQELCAYLSEHGVGNGTFYPVPLHRQKAFNRSNCKNPNASLPVAEEISSQSVCLPVFPEMTDAQARYVIDTVNAFYQEKEHA
ncbi:MAG: DegT/DnrJ/EryC1/StrS family aminotransferase [Acidaminococcaceae bacterium]|nr:DegT/DnrJ/EryC1/StrS family aminotransferase [Acidaminococcaceae bacterium]